MKRNWEQLSPQEKDEKTKKATEKKRFRMEDALPEGPDEKWVRHRDEVDLGGQRCLYRNESRLRYQDYVEFTRTAISLRLKLIILLWVLVSAGMGLSLLILQAFPKQDWAAMLLGSLLLVVGLVFLIYFFFVMPARNAKSYMKQDLRYAEGKEETVLRRFSFFETGVRTETEDGRWNAFYYNDIEKVYENARLYILQLDPKNGYLIRKDGGKEGSLEEVKPKIKRALEARKKHHARREDDRDKHEL